MGLEEKLYVKRFYVIEDGYAIISDNDFGYFSSEPRFTKEHGPYISKTKAQNKIKSLRTEKIEKGWTESENKLLPGIFREGRQDLWISYSVQEKFIPYKK